MNICYIITGLEPGGAEKLVLDFARKIGESNHRCIVCSLFGKGKLWEDTQMRNVEVIFLSRKSKRNPLIIFSLYRILKRIKADIVHTHLIHATLYGILAARLAGIRVRFTTEHNTSNWQSQYFLLHFLYRWIVQKNKKLFAISEAVKQRMISIGKLDEAKIDVLYNGIDVENFPYNRSYSKKHKQNYNKPVIGTIGRLDPRKGFRYLLEAAVVIIQRFPESTILIIGDGKERSFLEEYRVTLGLKNENIRFLGFRRNTEMYLNQMDVFILPSLEEGLGIAILEAMASGVPVVATSVGGIPEIVIHGETGILVEPKNPKALAEATISLLNNSTKAKRISRRAREMVVEKFSLDGAVHRLLKEYRQCLEDVERA